MSADVFVPISVGELYDKISILEIKAQRLSDPFKLTNVNREMELLRRIVDTLALRDDERLLALLPSLKAVNERIWDAEDRLRECERQECFDSGFVTIARSTYRFNDERSALKRQINVLTSSSVIEEKSYAAY